MKKLLKEVIEEIRPDKGYEKEILGKANKIISELNKGLKDCKAVLGGSGAKGTWLKTFDADVFVKFDYKKYADKSSSLSDILGKFVKKKFKAKRLHGSRDYFQIVDGKHTFEIIPILDIKNSAQARNITDVSPLHSKFVSKHKKLINDIRLSKQFFKAAHVYGAESHIKGFSGYVCEILTIYYGSFSKFIKAILLWKDKTVVDVAGHHKGKNVLMELNKSKIQSPIIVIDPVQADRNAAAALEQEKLDIIKRRARSFLKKPSKEFFRIKQIEPGDLKKKFGKNVFILKAKPLNKKEDVAGAKLLKSMHFIENELNHYGFQVEECDMIWNQNESFLYFYIKKVSLSKKVEIVGPPLSMKRHVSVFKKKYKNAKTKNKKLVASVDRKFIKAEDLIKNLMKKNNVKNNVSKIVQI